MRLALATITLPLHLNWSDPNRQLKLSDRDQRPVRTVLSDTDYAIPPSRPGRKDHVSVLRGNTFTGDFQEA